MPARIVRRTDVTAAQARLSGAPEQQTQTRLRVREMWEAAALLAGSDIGLASTTHSQLALHREALRVALTSLPAPRPLPIQSPVQAPFIPREVPFIPSEVEGRASAVQAPLIPSEAPFIPSEAPFIPSEVEGRGSAVLLTLAEPSTLPWLERLLSADPNLSEADATLTLGIARSAHRRALDTLEADVRTVKTWSQQRTVAIGAACFVTVALLVVGFSVVQRLRRPTDLAAGKPFTLSSSWTTCHPEEGECGGFPMKIAFHTNEQNNPWYMVDLGEKKEFSTVSIRNRTDVALMRAIPLIVEVSDDAQNFKQVAERTESFVEWEAKFTPQTARYVRVRVPRVTTLHLEAVRVHK